MENKSAEEKRSPPRDDAPEAATLATGHIRWNGAGHFEFVNEDRAGGVPDSIAS